MNSKQADELITSIKKLENTIMIMGVAGTVAMLAFATIIVFAV